MTDDLILLASAYLDGEATPDERALVEADPSLLEEVERLRTARTALLDAGRFERPRDDAREAAITAALTAWDFAALEPIRSASGSSPAVPQPAVVPFVRRHSYSARWLTAAAAVAAVAALGVIVAQFGGGEDSDDSAALDAATADTVVPAESPTEFEQIEPPAGTERALIGGVDDAADAAEDAAPDAALDAEVAGAADAQSAPEATAAAAEPAAAPEPSLESPEELGTFAADAKSAAENDLERDTLARPCLDEAFDEIDMYVAMGTYLGRPVVIGIDDEGERAFAVDADTCEIVAEAPLPSSG
jgi:hypothetical protein